jgi:cytochrome P450
LIREKLSNNEEFSYSDADLVDEFQTFLIAGTGTTTRFFTMMVYYIGKFP